MSEPEYLTHPEAAALLRMTPASLYQSRHELREPGTIGIPTGRKLLYPRAELLDFLERKRQEYQREVEWRRQRLEELAG